MGKDRLYHGQGANERNFAMRRLQSLADRIRMERTLSHEAGHDTGIVGGFEQPEYSPQRDPRTDQLHECIDIYYSDEARLADVRERLAEATVSGMVASDIAADRV